MKSLATILAALVISAMISSATAAEKLQHVVSFKFKTTTTAEDIKKVEQAFQGLKSKIPQIVALQWGTNVSKEKKDKGFTHCFILTFKNQQDVETYIAHPAHQAFVTLVGPLLDDVFVIDFWAKG